MQYVGGGPLTLSVAEFLKTLNEFAPLIQAIFTLFAVAIAIWVPFKIHYDDQVRQAQENRLKGQAIAVLVRPELFTIERAINQRSIIEEKLPGQIPIPAGITEQLKELWLMGIAGSHVLHLIAIIRAHNGVLADMHILPIDMEPGERREFSELFHERINLARNSLNNAHTAIQDLLNTQ